jgi:DNA-binding NarL/FixJ family response regulator
MLRTALPHAPGARAGRARLRVIDGTGSAGRFGGGFGRRPPIGRLPDPSDPVAEGAASCQDQRHERRLGADGVTRPGAGVGLAAVVVDAAGPELPAVFTRAGLRVVGRVAAASAAARLVAELQPRLVVIDLDAAPSALSAISAVTAAAPEIPVLVLAAAPDHATVLAAVRAGATSLLLTPGPEELAAAAARTAAGEAVYSPGLAELVLAEYGRPADPQLAARLLTEREADVLRLVVEGLTARQIATRLGLSPRTVENHVQRVLRKLHLRSRAALVRYAIETGLA